MHSTDVVILQVHITKEYLQLEPIGLVFVFFFALILVIQFTAMLFHRFGTLAHILASTSLDCCKKVRTYTSIVELFYLAELLHSSRSSYLNTTDQ